MGYFSGEVKWYTGDTSDTRSYFLMSVLGFVLIFGEMIYLTSCLQTVLFRTQF